MELGLRTPPGGEKSSICFTDRMRAAHTLVFKLLRGDDDNIRLDSTTPNFICKVGYGTSKTDNFTEVRN